MTGAELLLAAASTTPPASQPPVWISLVGGAAVGAFLTAVVSLFTGWLSRRHDARRWLLDKRLEVYVRFNNEVSRWQRILSTGAVREIGLGIRPVREVLLELTLLAPPDTTAQASAVGRHMLAVANVVLADAGRTKPTSAITGFNDAFERLSEAEVELLGMQIRDMQGARRWAKRAVAHSEKAERARKWSAANPGAC